MTQPYSMPTTNRIPFNMEYSRMNKAVISGLGATRTLLEEESGSLIILDRAAGVVLTLPAPKVGLNFEIMVAVSVTTNAYKIITDAGTTLFIGGVLSDDTDTSGAAVFFDANGSTHIALNMAGTTKGGLIGTRIRLTCVTSLLWLCEGVNAGSGTVETPWATS